MDLPKMMAHQPLSDEIETHAAPRADLLQQLLTFFDRADMPYCIVGDTRSIPAQIDGDVDIVVPQKAIDRLPGQLAAFCEDRELQLVQVIRHESTAYFCVLASRSEAGGLHFLQADTCGDYFRGGKRFLEAEELLENRIRAVDQTGREKDFYVPKPPAAFIYYLLKKVDKQDLSGRTGTYLHRQYRRAPKPSRAKMSRFWSDRHCEQIARAAQTNDWYAVRGQLPDLKAAMHEQMPTGLDARLREGQRILQRLKEPAGLFAALMGPDGSGKSSVSDRLMEDLKPAFWHRSYRHLRPKVGAKKDDRSAGPVEDPHGQEQRGWLSSVLKCGYYTADYNIGYLTQIRPQLTRATLVLYDRYYQDILVDPRRYRYSGPPSLARLCGQLLPRPELFIFLDAPAPILQQRKQELPFEETARQRRAYRKLADRLPNSHLIDASQELEEVVADVESILLNYMSQRTSNRFHAEVNSDD